MGREEGELCRWSGQRLGGEHFVIDRLAGEGLHVKIVKEPGCSVITFSFQPFGPSIWTFVMDEEGKIEQQTHRILTEGAPQVEADTDGSVYFLTNLFGQLEESIAFTKFTEQLPTSLHPGNEDESEQKEVGLPVGVATDGEVVGTVNDLKKAGQ